MNRNPLLLAFVRVGLFWYAAIALFFSGHSLGFYHGLFNALPDLANGLGKAITGCFTGAIIYLILYALQLGNTKHGLLPEDGKLIRFSVGKLTSNRTFKESPATIPGEFAVWFKEYKEAYPVHAKLFEHTAAIIHGNPDIPASAVPGGHGGASLETHSWNVLRAALGNQKTWVYQGTKTQRGIVAIPVYDPDYRFYPDPLIPLSAFCHDIGKIVCYRNENGITKEVKPRHDEEGAKLVAALPEFRELTFPDQEDLLICLGYYHHWRSIPLHVVDRGRALTEFLLMVDMMAGRLEGETVFETDHDTPDDSQEAGVAEHSLGQAVESGLKPEQSSGFVTHLGNIVEDEPVKRSTKKPANTNLDSQFEANSLFEKALGKIAQDPEPMVSPPPTPKAIPVATEQIVQIEGFKGIKRQYPKERCDKAFAMFARACREPGRLNAGGSTTTIGRKYGAACYVQEQNMRRAVSLFLEGEWRERMAQQNKEKQHPHEYTLAVMWALHDRGLLIREYKDANGDEWFVSPNNALFNVQWRDKTGAWVKRPACIVFQIDDELADLLDIPDCAAKPEIVKPFWASHQRKKEGDFAQ